MKKCILSLLLEYILFAVILTGCQTNDLMLPVNVNQEIGFIFKVGKNVNFNATLEEIYGEETEFVPAYWNIKNGVISINNEIALRTKGSGAIQCIHAWDGAEQFVIGSKELDYVIDKSSGYVLLPFDFEAENRLDYGNGYKLEITKDFRCILTLDCENPVTFDSIDCRIDIAGKSFTLSDLWYGGSNYSEGSLTIMFYKFGVLNPSDRQERYLVWVTLDSDSHEMRWSKVVPIPREYAPSSVDPVTENAAFADDKYYFSGGDTAAYLDLRSEEIIGLEKITDQLDALLPDAKREIDTWTDIVFPTFLQGNTNNIVVFVLGYDSTISEYDYAMYYALSGNQLLGVFSLERSSKETSISTYDGTLNLLQTIKVDDFPLKYAPIKFQCTNYTGI